MSTNYTATSLDNIADQFDRLAVTSDAFAVAAATQLLHADWAAEARTWRAAAAILRDITIVPAVAA